MSLLFQSTGVSVPSAHSPCVGSSLAVITLILFPIPNPGPKTRQAAFQLLEERDRLFPASVGWGNSGSNWGGGGGQGVQGGQGMQGGGGGGAGGTGGGTSVGVGEGRARLQGGVFGGRVIRSGTLRKATARSVGRLETTTWKTKYVELTPGRFAYADGPSVLGKRWVLSDVCRKAR